MKKHYLLFFLFTAFFAKAQDDAFITKWEIDYYPLFIMPVIEDPENNYTIDFGDGTVLTNLTGEAVHFYENPGIYTVTMTGVFKHIDSGPLNGGQNYSFKSIEQWGTNQWGSMNNAFRNLPNMVINATDAPDLSQVTDMSYMFAGCTSLNQNINHWDVSNVENMDGLFNWAQIFNQPLDDWDVSSVTSMEEMFGYATYFNQPLDNWDVSNVEIMKNMFMSATSFNQPISSWDITSVSDITGMFWWAETFNQPLNNWDVSGLTSTFRMFNGATSFNQPLDDWDVSNILNMIHMFSWASSFDQDLTDWVFNEDIVFSYFVTASGMGVTNYDLLLARFLELELEDKDLSSDRRYCNFDVHWQLEYFHGWSFQDYMAEDCGHNTIYGNVRFDWGSDGCDGSDLPMNMFLVNADNGNPFYSASVTGGFYELNVVEENTYSLNLLNVPDYFTVSVDNPEVTFSGFGTYEEVNFCVAVNESVEDLNIVLLPVIEARPGFPAEYQLVVQNMGTQTVDNATVTLNFDDALLSFLEANPEPASSITNQLTFEIEDLQPLESNMIDIAMEVFAPPVVNGGEIANFTASVTDQDDSTPADNTFTLGQEVVNSYDPNDKRVLQGEWIYEEQTDEYLNYIIRFQNTGTASAITVRIEDILHENLDWTTLMPLSASHNYRVEITDGNHVEFIFDNINLPHEEADEAGSNGFIAYKIKPITGIQVGDVMSGNASIFFDYNLPIITNTVTTEVIEPMEAGGTQNNVSCNGQNDGSVSVGVEGGWGDYSYSWSPAGGNAATATGLSAGEYTVTVTDGTGDSIMVDFTITQPGAITITAQPEDDTAVAESNAEFEVEASNVEEYQWQVSTNGTDWADITNGGTVPAYSGADTAELGIADVPVGHNGYLYRVVLVNGDDCTTYSSEAELSVTEIVTNTIIAVNDDFSEQTILEGTGGIPGDVTANDLFNDAAVDDTAITITVTNDGGLTDTVIDAEGNLTVPATAQDGTYTITYSICEAADDTNCSTATAVVVVSAVSGFEDHKRTDVTLYPNPASDKLYLQTRNDIQVQGVEIYNMQGRRMLSFTGSSESFEISSFSAGIYLVEVKTDHGIAQYKLVKN